MASIIKRRWIRQRTFCINQHSGAHMDRGVQIPPFNSYCASYVLRGQRRIEKPPELRQGAICATYIVFKPIPKPRIEASLEFEINARSKRSEPIPLNPELRRL